MICLFCEADGLPEVEQSLCPTCHTKHLLVPCSMIDICSWRKDPRIFAAFSPDGKTLDKFVSRAIFIDSGEPMILMTCWLPNEPLTTDLVAKMLSVSVDWAGKLMKAGNNKSGGIIGAYRSEPTRKNYTDGRWVAPRGDDSYGVYHFIRAKTKKAAQNKRGLK